MHSSIYDILIIGGGPAGCSAGIYATRKKMKTLLITKDFVGQVGESSQIENYLGIPEISGPNLTKKFEEHLKKFDIEIREGEEVVKVEVQGDNFLVKTKDKNEFLTKTVVIATGADPRPLEIPGEQKYIGKGVSYCSICDAPFFEDKQVVVVGGGNSGFETALELSSYAKKVFIFEKSDEIVADQLFQDRVAEKDNIEVKTGVDTHKIAGNGKVEAIAYKDTKKGREYQMPAEGVFVQIGAIPATGFVRDLVQFNENDEIKVNARTFQTSTPGIFAAGDVNNGTWKQIIIAAGEGAIATLQAYNYLRESGRI